MHDPYHYGVIARAIAHVQAAGPRHPSLAELAGAQGLSEAHFQRLFSQWAGVSPKRYVQYLTLEGARALLAAHVPVDQTAHSVGLSGPGRLHDLFLRWEAMTPGEYASGGAGLRIGWGWFDSPYGPLLAMGTARGLCGLALSAHCGPDAAMSDLRGRWPRAQFVPDAAALAPWVQAALGAAPDARGECRLLLSGTPLQIQVWQALMAVPEGAFTTYSALATQIGRPRAARAVGSAVGRNPLALLIPCHRVLRKGQGAGGYHWGLPVKQAILAREAARAGARLS